MHQVMSDEAQLIHSFPPPKRGTISDLTYDRQIREYVKAVEQLPSDVFLAGGMDGKGEDMLDVCNLLNLYEIPFYCGSTIQRVKAEIYCPLRKYNGNRKSAYYK